MIIISHILGTLAIIIAAWVPTASSLVDLTTQKIWQNFEVRHGPQGTGNYKGKRDRHEKRMPQHEKKKKKDSWIKR